MSPKELEAKYPLTAPMCPYCNKTTVRRRRYWRKWANVACKTPGCGGRGEFAQITSRGDWLWMKL